MPQCAHKERRHHVTMETVKNPVRDKRRTRPELDGETGALVGPGGRMWDQRTEEVVYSFNAITTWPSTFRRRFLYRNIIINDGIRVRLKLEYAQNIRRRINSGQFRKDYERNAINIVKNRYNEEGWENLLLKLMCRSLSYILCWLQQ